MKELNQYPKCIICKEPCSRHVQSNKDENYQYLGKLGYIHNRCFKYE